MFKEENKSINFETWKEMMSKDIFVIDDDKLKFPNKLHERFFDELEEEESIVPDSRRR